MKGRKPEHVPEERGGSSPSLKKCSRTKSGSTRANRRMSLSFKCQAYSRKVKCLRQKSRERGGGGGGSELLTLQITRSGGVKTTKIALKNPSLLQGGVLVASVTNPLNRRRKVPSRD